MGCCQTSLLGSEFQSSPTGSINIQERGPDKGKLIVPISLSGENAFPTPILTPFFGKNKFKFDDIEKGSHEGKSLEIN